MNRAELEKKRLESLSRPSQPMTSESTVQPQEPPKARKLYIAKLTLQEFEDAFRLVPSRLLGLYFYLC